MASVDQNGTQTATLTTRHQLGTTITTDGIYQLSVDTSNLANDEEVLLEVEKLYKSAGTYRVVYQASFKHTQTDSGKDSIPVTLGYGLKFYLTQTGGTGRAFDWLVYSL